MSERGGSGHYNRAGRRSGGQRPINLRVGINMMVAGRAVLGPLCLMGKHELCERDCVCECHGAASDMVRDMRSGEDGEP